MTSQTEKQKLQYTYYPISQEVNATRQLNLVSNRT